MYFSSYRIFIRQPSVVDVDWGNFLAPFNCHLWLSIVAIMVVVSVLVEACQRLTQRFGKYDAECLYRPFFRD
jgi:hypothetical protein